MSLLRMYFFVVSFCVRYAFFFLVWHTGLCDQILFTPHTKKRERNSNSTELELVYYSVQVFIPWKTVTNSVHTIIGSQKKKITNFSSFIHLSSFHCPLPSKKAHIQFKMQRMSQQCDVLRYVFISYCKIVEMLCIEIHAIEIGVLFITTVRFQLLWCCSSSSHINQPRNSVLHKLSHMWRWTGNVERKLFVLES